VAWLLIQIVTQVFPFFEIPNWAIRFVVLVIVISFPIARSSSRRRYTEPTTTYN
jgi:hypothetical protein